LIVRRELFVVLQCFLVTVHKVHSSSSDRRDIPVPHHGTAGLENPAYRAFVVPVNGYPKGYHSSCRHVILSESLEEYRHLLTKACPLVNGKMPLLFILPYSDPPESVDSRWEA